MRSNRIPKPLPQAMTKPKVDTALIEALAELLQRTGLTEIELAEGNSRIRVVQAPQPLIAQVRPCQQPRPRLRRQSSDQATPQTALEQHPGAVRAPMVGTVYLTPEPGAQPFVTLGGEVREGQTLLIIEAMKVVNPIRASRSGRIAKLLVSNGDPVEYGELLLIIR